MFAQGSFINTADATPESIALKRAQIAALMPRFGQARYVGEGLGQLATGIGMGIAGRKLDKAESAGRASAKERFDAILGGGVQGRAQPGGFSVLGSMPMPEPDPNSPHALGNDAMAALGKAPIATAADPASIRAGLIARGLPEHVADGFVMNMKDESGLNPGINEIAPLVPGSRGGFGLYQLTGPRRVAYEKYATERGMPLDSVDAQLDFMMAELQGPEAAAASRIMAAPDAGSAAAAIVTDFLRPSPEHRDRRVAQYTGGTMTDAMASPQMAAATVPMDALVAIISDPWSTPEQKAQAQSMLDQQTQMNDPAYRMGLRADELAIQKAERELAAMDQPQTPAQVAERQALAAAGGLQPGTPEYQSFMLTGELPGAGGSVPADFRSLQLRAEAAGLQPGTPEYQSFMQQGAGGGAPAAFVALDMQAQAAGFTPGTPEYREFMATRGAGLQAQAKVEGTAAGEAVTGLGAARQKADRAIALIDDIANDPALPSITGMVQGNIPAGTPLFGGGQAGVDLDQKIQQLQGTAFLEAFDALKGGGAITEIEGQKAERAMARLNRAQSTEAYIAALNELKQVVQDGMARAQDKASSAQMGGTSTGGKTRLRYNPETGMVE